MDDPTPTPQNSTPEGQAANRQQYAALTPALEAWRASVWQRIAQMEGCKHTFAKMGTIFVCQKCGMASPVIEAADEIEYW